MKVAWIGLFFLCMANLVEAQPPEDLHGLLPADNEVSGWVRRGTPQNYRGDNLFEMIDGGADIYHEYGFTQVLRVEYENQPGKMITLEMYEMADPAAAYGIYSFKIGRNGQSVDIGQEAFLEEYFVNFWKGKLLVTVIGSDSDQATIRGVLALAGAVAKHYEPTAEKPALANLLLGEPLPLTHPIYVRGDLGVMNTYIFDTKNIFHVREGLIGSANDYRVFVLRYRDDTECLGIFKGAIAKFAAGSRFKDGMQQEDSYSMIDRKQEVVMVHRAGQNIIIVIGPKLDQADAIMEQIAAKLKVS